jgi:GntR family transcriptional repressor for pyruvate dehydrogenase complex
MKAMASVRRETSPDALRSILDFIREQGLAVGAQLPSIRELAERLELKPTAVRDALLRAQTMGLVRVRPRSGAFLTALVPADTATPPAGGLFPVLTADAPNVFHLLDARRLIEIELAGRAAERRRLEDLLPVRRALEAMLALPEATPRAEHVAHDIRFHVEIARLAGNDVLFAVQRTLLEQLRPHLNEVPQSLQRRSLADRSHAAIYDALVAGAPERTRTEMREHLSLAYDGLLRSIQEPLTVGRRRASAS